MSTFENHSILYLMKKKSTLTTLAFALVLGVAFLTLQSSSGGRNNDTACSNCHFGGTADGFVTLTWSAGDNLTYCINDADAVVGGFRVVASSGTLTPGGDNRNGGSTNSITQSFSKSFSGGQVCWNFSWSGTGSIQGVTFSSWANAANGNGSSGNGDVGYAMTFANLPVEFISFDARMISDNTVMLDWSTATEENSMSFEVQRSLDGRDYSTIDVVDAAGESTEILDYQYRDDITGLNGNIYYRLRQVDYDGSFMFSRVVNINAGQKGKALKLYPNILSVGQQFRLIMDTEFEGNATVSIFNTAGQKVKAFNVSSEDLLNGLETGADINTPGTYFLVLENQAAGILETTNFQVTSR